MTATCPQECAARTLLGMVGDDDASRFAHANAIGGERGELIAIQCVLASGKLRRDLAIERRQREAELLAQSGEAWAGLAGLASAWTFRRGFVDAARIDAKVFAQKAEAIFTAAPTLTRVEFVGLHDIEHDEIARRLDAVLASAFFSRLRGIRFDRVGNTVETDMDTHPHDFESAGSAVLRRLLESGRLRTLSSLELPRCALSFSDIARLVDSTDVAGVVELDVGHQSVDRYMGLYPNSVQAIVESPQLARLEVLGVAGALGHAPWTAGSTRAQRAEASRKQSERDPELMKHPRVLGLRRLSIADGGFSDGMIEALATAPFERLELLDISQNELFADDLERLGAAPGLANLVELVCNGPSKYTVSTKMAAALGLAARFDSLKVLRLRNGYMSLETARTLLSSPLAARLEVIDLRRNGEVSANDASLRKLFDGVLLTGES